MYMMYCILHAYNCVIHHKLTIKIKSIVFLPPFDIIPGPQVINGDVKFTDNDSNINIIQNSFSSSKLLRIISNTPVLFFMFTFTISIF